jgi:hypothetical protein
MLNAIMLNVVAPGCDMKAISVLTVEKFLRSAVNKLERFALSSFQLHFKHCLIRLTMWSS